MEDKNDFYGGHALYTGKHILNDKAFMFAMYSGLLKHITKYVQLF